MKRFRRDVSSESPVFAGAYNLEYDRGAVVQPEVLEGLLRRLTAECEDLRKTIEDKYHPERARLEGRRAAVHDLHFCHRFMTCSKDDLKREFERLTNNPRKGIRLDIARWAMMQRQIPFADQRSNPVRPNGKASSRKSEGRQPQRRHSGAFRR